MELAESGSDKKKIGIIGGGIAGRESLQMFQGSSLAEVVYMVDSDPNAPGMQDAKRLGIKTISRMEAAIASETVDFIINATGSREMQENILRQNASSEVVSASMAFLMFKVMDEGRKSTYQQVFQDLSGIRQEIDNSTRDVSKTLHGINKISNELEVLAINAGIQASRAAQFGKGFAVVAGEVKATARVARGLAGDIERVINEISSMSEKIEQSLKKIL
ncbi:MAG: hypothetical protein G8345_13595 [Magnetococcales bacterium]|nr:hypothetical protein [Magnetococcales bacterium]